MFCVHWAVYKNVELFGILSIRAYYVVFHALLFSLIDPFFLDWLF